jgi:hypothetical protein
MSGMEAPPEALAGRSRFDWLARAGALVSFAAPFGVALAAAGSTSAWRDDHLVVQGIGCIGREQRGGVSAWLAEASRFVPLGALHFRLALTAALVLGAAGLAVHRLAREILGRQASTPLLVSALSTIAALTVMLSVTAQSEGGVAGGSGVALFLAVMILVARPVQGWQGPGKALYLGMLIGTLALESTVTVAVLVVAIAAGVLVEEERPTRDVIGVVGGAALACWGLLRLPRLIRSLAPAPLCDFGRAIAKLEEAAPAKPLGGVLGRLGDEGVVLVALAALGLGLAVATTRLRGAALSLAVLIVLYAFSVLVEGRFLTAEDIAPLHLLAIVALAVGAAMALAIIAGTLLAWRLPMARGAAILLVMTDLTFAVAGAEDSSFANDRSGWRGADAFTDEALEQLPPRAALLVRSRDTALRVWAAQLEHGTRPDVLVVPVPATGDAPLALGLLRAEPALQKALQDISLEGRPGEEALTILADARPVLVELDRGWDRRVVSHFVPDHLWLRFLPEPRGPSDRKAAFTDLANREERVRAASLVGGKPDPTTSRILRGRLIDSALVAAQLGDRDEATALAARIGAVPGGELFSAQLMQRLLTSKSGPIDVKGLAP